MNRSNSATPSLIFKDHGFIQSSKCICRPCKFGRFLADQVFDEEEMIPYYCAVDGQFSKFGLAEYEALEALFLNFKLGGDTQADDQRCFSMYWRKLYNTYVAYLDHFDLEDHSFVFDMKENFEEEGGVMHVVSDFTAACYTCGRDPPETCPGLQNFYLSTFIVNSSGLYVKASDAEEVFVYQEDEPYSFENKILLPTYEYVEAPFIEEIKGKTEFDFADETDPEDLFTDFGFESGTAPGSADTSVQYVIKSARLAKRVKYDRAKWIQCKQKVNVRD